jgi:hypothetical protein
VATAAATDIPEYYANTNGNGYPTDTDRRGFDTMSFDFTVRSCAVSPPHHPPVPCMATRGSRGLLRGSRRHRAPLNPNPNQEQVYSSITLALTQNMPRRGSGSDSALGFLWFSFE